MKILIQIRDFALLATLGAVFVFIGHNIGYKNVNPLDSLIGISVILAIAITGYSIGRMPYLEKVPLIVWVSGIGVLSASAISPISGFVLATAGKIPFMAITTVALTFAGLSLGKDIEAFKNISWKIIPVALAAIAGVFTCATTIAQIALTLSGNI